MLNIPDEIKERTMNYIYDSDEIFNIINDILEKINDKTDTIKLKDIFEMAKSFFILLTTFNRFLLFYTQ